MWTYSDREHGESNVSVSECSVGTVYAWREKKCYLDDRGESRRCSDLPMGSKGCQARSNTGSEPISHLCMGGHSAVETPRRQLAGVGSLPPQYRFQRVNSDH